MALLQCPREESAMTPRDRLRRPGGTSGGLGMFLLGFVMAVAGGYLFLDRVTVISTSWRLWNANGFGLSLVPLLFGVFFLFLNGRSIVGWLLTIAGTVIIFAGVITHLDIFFERTSLFQTLMMLVLLVGGLGLVVRSLRGVMSSGDAVERYE
jgi:hypothetical protein